METLHPGLYFQEIPGAPPVEGVSTSTGAFVGVCRKGAIGEPIFVTSWPDFVFKCGSYTNDGYLAYAVRAFFQNGGSRAYISRVVHFEDGEKTSAPAMGALKSEEATPNLIGQFFANSDGVWGNDIVVKIQNYDDVNEVFDVVVEYAGDQVELFEGLTIKILEDTINNGSNYVTLNLIDEESGIKNQIIEFDGGDDGLDELTDVDYVGDQALKSGLYAFDNVKVNLVAIPGITSVAVHTGIIAYVEGRKDCWGILDAPLGKTPSAVLDYKTTANLASPYCELVYPWLYATDPIGVGKNPMKLLPPSGYIAGITARIDNSRGVWKAPAGTEAVLLGTIKLEYEVNDAEQDILNPNMINCIRSIPGYGICSWGARSLTKGDYTYKPVRRTNTYIINSLLSNLGWAVFEPNDEVLWGRVKTTCEGFLKGIKDLGGLKDFFVICDGTINTPEVVDAGRCYVDIGVANLKPAEFIVFRLSLFK